MVCGFCVLTAVRQALRFRDPFFDASGTDAHLFHRQVEPVQEVAGNGGVGSQPESGEDHEGEYGHGHRRRCSQSGEQVSAPLRPGRCPDRRRPRSHHRRSAPRQLLDFSWRRLNDVFAAELRQEGCQVGELRVVGDLARNQPVYVFVSELFQRHSVLVIAESTHRGTPDSLKDRLSDARALRCRALTAPMPLPSVWAVCSTERSAMTLNARTSRWSSVRPANRASIF